MTAEYAPVIHPQEQRVIDDALAELAAEYLWRRPEHYMTARQCAYALARQRVADGGAQ